VGAVDGNKESDPDRLMTFHLNQLHHLKIGMRKIAIVEFTPDGKS